jgi:GT2 family glycosyltransferase
MENRTNPQYWQVPPSVGDTDILPSISVVIATYDRPASLTRCLESLRGQRITREFETIVVDNHPQSQQTQPVAHRFPEVRWLAEPIAGLSMARNHGIAAARGEVIVTTDDDVIAPAEWLELLTAPLFERSVAATTGNCLPARLDTEAEVLFEAYGGLRHGDTPAEFDASWLARWRLFFPQLWRIGTTANAAFRASLFRELGLFEMYLGAGSPPGAWEDLDYFYRMLRAGHRIAYLPEAQVLHAHREDLAGLRKQLCGYRRGETAFLTLVLLRHGDYRALGQMLLWIPCWRASLLFQSRFPWRLQCAEWLAYLQGPWSLWRAHRQQRSPSTVR